MNAYQTMVVAFKSVQTQMEVTFAHARRAMF